MLMRRFSELRERGDTMVEVLIAIAIISLILVSAYAITNKNTQAIQATQERIQAQHLAESQIEALKAAGSFPAGDDCFSGTAAASGAPCTNISEPGSGADYDVKITPEASNTYQVAVNWTSLGATANNDSNVTMWYRLQ